MDQLRELQNKSFLRKEKQDGLPQLLALLIKTTQSTCGFVVKVVEEEEEALEKLSVLAFRDKEGPLDNNNLATQNYWKCHPQITSLSLLFEQVKQRETALLIDLKVSEENKLRQLACFSVYHDDEIIGLIAVVNRSVYPENILETVASFLPIFSNVLRNIRLQRKQKKYEADLTAAKELAEEAVHAKNLLFTNISHELRTPLSLVVGPVSALLQPHQELSADARESLEMVLRNSKKMLQYINDIMDLAKLNSSTLELQVRDNHLHTFIQSIYQAFEVQKRYRELNYQLVYEANQDLVLQFDSKKLEKVINNLLSNAFKYTPDGGTICLQVREEADHLHIEVSDTGVGIGAEELPHIFKRFYQSKNAQQISAKGTGIGLALAQELAQLQGFCLEIESKLNLGTRLFFKMPKQETPMAQSQANDTIGGASLSSRDPKKPSILIVEDNHDMAAFVKLVLQNDYNIDLAANGAIGWQMLQQVSSTGNVVRPPYNLIITDLMMPEMDGFELLRHIKGSSWGGDMPVIVLTARADTESKLEALTIGVDEYLTKPFSVEELTIHVKNLIQNAEVRQQAAEETDEAQELFIGKEGFDSKSSLTIAQKEKIQEARRVVLEHLDNTEFSVDNLARALITSKRQLYRFMQLHTGLTPLKFINEIRLQEARRMLENGLCSTVKEVSYSIGFMSTRHFSKTYSNRFGKKPSEYLR